jgi:hypothetical protein
MEKRKYGKNNIEDSTIKHKSSIILEENEKLFSCLSLLFDESLNLFYFDVIHILQFVFHSRPQLYAMFLYP